MHRKCIFINDAVLMTLRFSHAHYGFKNCLPSLVSDSFGIHYNFFMTTICL